jgi:transposase
MCPVPQQSDLFPVQDLRPPSGTVPINARCTLRTKDGDRAVLVAGMPIAHYARGDRMAEAYAMVTLVDQGWADQVEVARAFGCATRTVRRMQRRFDEGGLPALGLSPGFPKGQRRARAGRLRRVHELKSQGLSNRAIAGRLGVTENAVRKLVRRLGWKTSPVQQAELPLVGAHPNLSAPAPSSARTSAPEPGKTALPLPIRQSDAPSEPAAGAHPNLSASRSPWPPPAALRAEQAASDAPMTQPDGPSGGAVAADPNLSASVDDEPLPVSFDSDPSDRRIDRLFAHIGLLDDAAPLFRSGPRVPRAGVLLALPALLDSSVLACAREVYGSIGPAFYGLRTSIVALLFMALLRIRRPEGLKEHSPDDLGRLLGLDRAPEVKTLRRKLTRLAAAGRATFFGRALAQRRVASRGAALGFLYLDGHVRVYHGKHAIPKAHVARMRISMPATTDYWVNDVEGEPLFVVTAEANAGLVKMLPPILAEVKGLLGERRVTIVFDRGGYSPRLFQEILAAGFDVLTYRKGRTRRVPARHFRQHRATLAGCKVRYELADQRVLLLGRKLRLRQVTRRSDDGHQTPILTSRFDLPAVEVAYRMFERWRQENFFKYMREEYALDALAEHAVEEADPAREVPNPHWHELDAKLRAVRGEVIRLSAQYGLEAFTNVESLRRTMRGFKIAKAAQSRELVRALERYAALEKRRAAVPQRVPVRAVVDGPVVRLAGEKKHLTNLFKMVAYQAESDLMRLVTPHYKRAADDGRTLVQSALASAADIEVKKDELVVTLAPQSSAHRTRAIAELCQDLNSRASCFPGTRLRLRFGIGTEP